MVSSKSLLFLCFLSIYLIIPNSEVISFSTDDIEHDKMYDWNVLKKEHEGYELFYAICRTFFSAKGKLSLRRYFEL